MACLSKDPYMCDSFRKGVDFHTATSAVMLDKDPKDITEAERDLGKIFNFGLSFGMTAKGLSYRLGVSEEEAERKIEEYFAKLPGLVKLINDTKARALTEECTYTFFGRRRPLLLKGLPGNLKESLLRKSFNTKIQGTAADILKIAMIRINDSVLKKFKGDVEMIMTVHDECDFLVRTEKREEILQAIQKAMEIPVPNDWVPIKVELMYGPNWSETFLTKWKHPYEAEPFQGWGTVLPPDLKVSVTHFN